MKINLLSDYRGVLTDEVFYKAGIHDLPNKQANALVAAKRAVEVEKKKTVRTKRASKQKQAK